MLLLAIAFTTSSQVNEPPARPTRVFDWHDQDITMPEPSKSLGYLRILMTETAKFSRISRVQRRIQSPEVAFTLLSTGGVAKQNWTSYARHPQKTKGTKLTAIAALQMEQGNAICYRRARHT